MRPYLRSYGAGQVGGRLFRLPPQLLSQTLQFGFGFGGTNLGGIALCLGFTQAAEVLSYGRVVETQPAAQHRSSASDGLRPNTRPPGPCCNGNGW